MLVEISPRQTVLSMLPKNAVGAEIGLFKGAFSAELLRRTSPRKLHLIDPWVAVHEGPHVEGWYGANNVDQRAMDDIHQSVVKRFADGAKADIVVIHRGTSADILSAMADESLDWVYIDGDHSYDGVLADLHMAFKKVRRSGIIAGDDYFVGKWWKDGVVRALHDFLAAMGAAVTLRMVADTQFVLQRHGRNIA